MEEFKKRIDLETRERQEYLDGQRADLPLIPVFLDDGTLNPLFARNKMKFRNHKCCFVNAMKGLMAFNKPYNISGKFFISG